MKLWPCPKCGDPDSPTVGMRAQGFNTYLIACRKCFHKGPDMTTRDAAINAWNSESERAAQVTERRAKRALQAQASALRKDDRFIAAVLDRYVGRMQFLPDGPHYQSFKLRINGELRAVNVPVFVDQWLAGEWPELRAHKDPDRIVYHVLEDAGKGTRESYVCTGEFIGTRTEHRTREAIGPTLELPVE